MFDTYFFPERKTIAAGVCCLDPRPSGLERQDDTAARPDEAGFTLTEALSAYGGYLIALAVVLAAATALVLFIRGGEANTDNNDLVQAVQRWKIGQSDYTGLNNAALIGTTGTSYIPSRMVGATAGTITSPMGLVTVAVSGTTNYQYTIAYASPSQSQCKSVVQANQGGGTSALVSVQVGTGAAGLISTWPAAASAVQTACANGGSMTITYN